MNTKDLSIYESGNGGELQVVNNDLVLSESLFNQVYLSLFGGNLEASTRGDEPFNQERFDYWQNSLFNSEFPSKQLNSQTEILLTNLVLNSSGRLQLIQAVTNDLDYLRGFIKFSADVSFESSNIVKIIIKFELKSNDNDTFTFVYDNSKNELITEIII